MESPPRHVCWEKPEQEGGVLMGDELRKGVPEVVEVRGKTVAALRQHAGVGKRTLARALASARGAGGDHRAIEVARQFVLRLEARGGAIEMRAEEAAAIAEALGVEVEDLGSELRWVVGARGTPMWFGRIVPCWRDASDAADFRDHVVMAGLVQRAAQVLPTPRSALVRAMAENAPGWEPEGAMVDDIDRKAWPYLVGLELLLREEADRLRTLAAVDPAIARAYAPRVHRLDRYASQVLGRLELRVDYILQQLDRRAEQLAEAMCAECGRATGEAA